MAARPDRPARLWLLAAGAIAELARSQDAPPALDRAVACSWILVLGATLTPSSAVPAGAALAAALLTEAAYTVDAGMRQQLRLRLSQPLLLVAFVVWMRGLGGAVVLEAADVYLHDTYAEVAPEHLLGPFLAGLVLLAWLAHRLPATRATWAGAGLCALLLVLGVRWTAAGLWTLGEAGMPRRYWGVVLELGQEQAWLDLAIGATLLIAGGLAAAVGYGGAPHRGRER